MSKDLPSDTFCVLPFMHVAVNPGGGYRVCCNSNPKNNKIMKDDDPSKSYRIYKDNIEDVWNSKHYQEIRKQFINGERPETCQRCFREEDAGIRSPRAGYNEKWFKEDVVIKEEIPVDVRYIDLRLGNLCNLKCRMCNPWSSSMWVKDWNSVVETAELMPSSPLTKEEFDHLEVMQQWPDRKQTATTFVELAHTIEEIYLTGGEPTLATSQYALFDYCIENDLANNIRLKYNTNLTNVPAKMLEYWKHFKRVQLNCSIDATGSRDRYIRYPSNWSKIEENFDKLNGLPNVNIQIHCTVQALNMVAMTELFEWLKGKGIKKEQVYLNILNHPECMNIRVLPKQLKELAEEKLQPWLHVPKVEDTIKYMWAEDWHAQRWQEFVDFNVKTDDLQKGQLLDACPEFKGHLTA
jgi:MoaA/NifB/PqqE/SkfB family radical SAM enzyme